MKLPRKVTVWFLTLVMTLSIIPQTVFAEEKNTSPLQYEITQQMSEDKTEATISLVFAEMETVQLEKLRLPDGTEITENLTVVQYNVSDNGAYDFLVTYTVDGIRQEETIEVEAAGFEEKGGDENNEGTIPAGEGSAVPSGELGSQGADGQENGATTGQKAFVRTGNSWEVSDKVSFDQAVAEVEQARDKEGLTEATIVFTQDINLEGADHSDYTTQNNFGGIPGMTVTLTSKEQPVKVDNLGKYLYNTPKVNVGVESETKAYLLVGDLILDKIQLDTSSNHTLFAQGNHLTFTENFTATDELYLYGGGIGKYTILEDGSIDYNGGNFAETNLVIRGGKFGIVYGGSLHGNIAGNTNITVAASPDNSKIDSLYGGGDGQKTNASNAMYGAVGGDTNVTLSSGTFGYVYGGGYASGSNTISTRYAAVKGDTHVTVGGKSGQKAIFSHIYGGGIRSSVKNTNVTIEATAEGNHPDPYASVNIIGGGSSDIVQGTIHVTVNGGNKLGTIFAGCGNENYNLLQKVENQEQKEFASFVEINGGTMENVYGCHFSDFSQNPSLFAGSVKIVMNGGTVNGIILAEKKSTIQGDSICDVKRGTFKATPSIKGYEQGNDTTTTGETRVNFINDQFVKTWQIAYVDTIYVDNSKDAVIRDYKGTPAISNVKNMQIEQGTLGITGTNEISGNLTVNGTLALTRTDHPDNKDEKGTVGTLSAGGTFTGTGKLRPIKTNVSYFLSNSNPVEGEEYIYAKDKANSTAKLTLEPERFGLYVAHDTTDSAKDIWKIAKDPNADNVTVTFEKNGGDTEADPASLECKKGEALGQLPKAPAREGYQFVGWNTQQDGKGTAFDENMVVNNDMTVYAQWTPLEYEVDYEFVPLDSTGTLPKKVMQQLPSKEKVKYQETACPSKTQFDEVAADTGKWVFKGWTPEKIEAVTSDVKFTGTWEFVSEAGTPGVPNGTDDPTNKKHPVDTGSVKTGDQTDLTLWGILLLVSGIGIFVAYRRRELDRL